jgi:oligogalacturonide lyase
MRWSIVVAALCAAAPAGSQTGGQPPRSWIDPDTGHRIVRLTNEPDSASLYFDQNGYTADGSKMIYTTSSTRRPREFPRSIWRRTPPNPW